MNRVFIPASKIMRKLAMCTIWKMATCANWVFYILRKVGAKSGCSVCRLPNPNKSVDLICSLLPVASIVFGAKA